MGDEDGILSEADGWVTHKVQMATSIGEALRNRLMMKLMADQDIGMSRDYRIKTELDAANPALEIMASDLWWAEANADDIAKAAGIAARFEGIDPRADQIALRVDQALQADSVALMQSTTPGFTARMMPLVPGEEMDNLTLLAMAQQRQAEEEFSRQRQFASVETGQARTEMAEYRQARITGSPEEVYEEGVEAVQAHAESNRASSAEGMAYDSMERRAALAGKLTPVAGPEASHARVVADTSFATPAGTAQPQSTKANVRSSANAALGRKMGRSRTRR